MNRFMNLREGMSISDDDVSILIDKLAKLYSTQQSIEKALLVVDAMTGQEAAGYNSRSDMQNGGVVNNNNVDNKNKGKAIDFESPFYDEEDDYVVGSLSDDDGYLE